MTVKAGLAGSTVACPHCGQHIVVPDPAAKPKRGGDLLWVAVTVLVAGGIILALMRFNTPGQDSAGQGGLREIASKAAAALAPAKPGSEAWGKATMAEIEFQGQSGVIGLLLGVGGTPADEMAAELKETKENMEEMKKEVFRLRLLNGAEAKAGADARRRTISLSGSPYGGSYNARATLLPDRFRLWPKDGGQIKGKWLDVRERDGEASVFVIDLKLEGDLQADGSYQGQARGNLLQPGSNDEKTMLFVNGPFTLRPIVAK